MATYTVSSGRLICTGNHITSAGIKAAVDANPSVGTATQILGNDNSRDTYIFDAEITIGDNSTASLWNPQNEFIQINSSEFLINGNNAELRLGRLDGSGNAENVCAFCYASTVDSYDRFSLLNGGDLTVYGGFFAVTANDSSRGRIDPSANSVVLFKDADLEIEDSVGTASAVSLSGHSITYTGCRVHHTGAVGIKLYNAPSNTLEKTKIESCRFAIQPGTAALVLKDLEVDTCTYHVVPNVSACDVTWINPDFTILRGQTINYSDVNRVAFRYDFTVVDSGGSPISGATVRIVDQATTVVVNNQATDTSGKVDSSLPTYDGIVCLNNSTFAGTTKTNRQTHTRSIIDYNYIIKQDTLEANADIVDTAAILTDSLITETTKATVDAYTTIDDAFEWYDRAKANLFDRYAGETVTDVDRSGSQIEIGSNNWIVDSGAVSVYDFSTKTIKSSTFTGGATGTGSVTIQGATVIQNARYDCNINYSSTATTLTNITCTGALDFDTAGTYNLVGCEINEVTNSSGGAITLSLTNGSTITTNTGPSITVQNPRTLVISGLVGGSRIQIYNMTTATELYNAVEAGTSYTYNYNEGVDVTTGDTIRLRATYCSGLTAYKGYESRTIATSGGFAMVANQETDEVYGNIAIDGSTVTKFSADYTGEEVDLTIGSNWTGAELYAWWVCNTFSELGIRNFFGAVEAQDDTNFLIRNSLLDLYFDNTTSSNVYQSDNRRIYREDGSYPVKDPTTGGGGIDIVWKSRVFAVAVGSGSLTPAQEAILNSKASQASVDALPNSQDNADAVWSKSLS